MAFALSVHSKAVGALASTTFTTPGIDTTGCCLIVVNQGALAAGTLSDSKSNVWVPLTAHTRTSISQQLYYCLHPIVGTGHTFTITSATSGTITVLAFTETSNTVVFDQESGANGTVSPAKPGSLTPVANNSVFVAAAVAQNGIGGVTTVDSSFTAVDDAAGTGVNEQENAYFIQTTAGAKNPGFTTTGNGGLGSPWACGMAVFRPGVPGSVTAVKMTATALAVPPAVTGKANVTAVVATATAALVAPAVKAAATIQAVKGTATALLVPPVVSGKANALAVKMTATAAMLAPAVGVSTSVQAVAMAAAAALVPPAVTAAVQIAAASMTATAALMAPTVGAGAAVQATVAMALARMLAPLVVGSPPRPVIFRPASTTGTPGNFRPTVAPSDPPKIFRGGTPADDPGVFRPN